MYKRQQWDPVEKWEVDLQELLPYVDVFLPNMSEFLALTSSKTIEAGISEIMQFAPKLTVVVKDGANGAYGLSLIHI